MVLSALKRQWRRSSRAPTAPHARVALVPVNNRPETGRPPRRSFSTPAGCGSWLGRSTYFAVGSVSPKCTALPALMLRSIAARRVGKGFNSLAALRCVSKHEGAPRSLVFILRDARTRVRLCGTASACALLRMRTNRVCHPISQCQTASLLRSRGAFLRPGFCILLRSPQ